MYALEKNALPEVCFAALGAKHVNIATLREVDFTEFGKSFTKGFKDNSSKSEMHWLVLGLIKMAPSFSAQKKMVVGKPTTLTGFQA